MKINDKDVKESFKALSDKFKLLLQKVRHFNLTLYLLTKNEQKLVNNVEIKEGLIEFYQGRILVMKLEIVEFEKAIIEEGNCIKNLNKDIKKIRKVINLKIK